LKTLEPFLESFKKTQAEEMRLEPGQRLAMVMTGHEIPVGREPLQPGTLLQMAAEALNQQQLSALAQKAHTLTTVHSGERFEVTFSRPNGAVHISVRRTSSAPAAPAPAKAPATPAAAPRPAPSAPPAPAPAAAPTSFASSGEMDSILRLMVESGASDLHLASGSYPVLRVHGEIKFLRDRGVLGSEDIRGLLYSILDEAARQAFEERGDADCAYEIPGLSRFRVNVFEDRNGVGSVIRTIPVSILTAQQLGLPQAVLDLCFLTKGLVLVTGPTGSGKSTTLAAMVDHINKNRSDHIITIEDPIEFVHQNQNCLVNQREVGRHTKSFKAALRAALREDPDIVLVGEMRDLETISIAIETAETGHLVFGTLHTNTAVATVDRIIDQFPPDQQAQIRVMLADSLKGVVAQVLCKKKGGGRVAALEVLLGNMALASLIREGKTFQIPSIMQTSKKAGMTTMNDSLFSLVKQGLVEPKEAWMKSVDKSGLVGLFKSGGIPVDFATP
jgi:twitching motility protein PilT